FGVEKAREVVEGIPSKYMECYYSTLCYCTKAKKYSDRFNPRIELVNMADLKRLVESLDLTEMLGGIDALNGLLDMANSPFSLSGITRDGVFYSSEKIKELAQVHESIYGGSHES
ncbi:hypothetical protein KWE42_10305, partial [Acinetobacter pittii]